MLTPHSLPNVGSTTSNEPTPMSSMSHMLWRNGNVFVAISATSFKRRCRTIAASMGPKKAVKATMASSADECKDLYELNCLVQSFLYFET